MLYIWGETRNTQWKWVIQGLRSPPSPQVEWSFVIQAHHQGKRDARISRHMRGAVPTAPRSPSQITWPKIKNPGRGRVTARLHHLSQVRRKATKNYLLNIKITTIHTSVWFIVHDADRKTSKRSKVPQKKNLTRKERGKRKGSRKADRRGVTQEQVQ